jgi:hypothetical protein
LQTTQPDIGDYLWKQGRNAIAHAYADPILDPDLPTDRAAATRDADLMQGLAEVFIQEEMGVPSQRRIWQEHLYELQGLTSPSVSLSFADRYCGKLALSNIQNTWVVGHLKSQPHTSTKHGG